MPSRRFWLITVVLVLVIGAIIALSLGSAGDGPDTLSTDEVTEPPQNAAPRTPAAP